MEFEIVTVVSILLVNDYEDNKTNCFCGPHEGIGKY